MIFDCDGVLVDSEVVVAAAQLEFFAQQGFTLAHEEYVTRFLGLTNPDWRAALSALMQESIRVMPDEEFFTALGERIRDRLASELVAVPGATEVLKLLPGRRCVASSSSAQSLLWKLEQTALLSQFDGAVYSGDLVSQGKPAPDLFLYAAGAGATKPVDCVVVEDSVNGVLAAKRAGMRVIGLTAGSHCLPNHADSLIAVGADQVVADWEHLAQLLS